MGGEIIGPGETSQRKGPTNHQHVHVRSGAGKAPSQRAENDQRDQVLPVMAATGFQKGDKAGRIAAG